MKYRTVLERAFTHALHYLEYLDQTSVSATASPADLRTRLARPLAQEGMDAVHVIDELVADVDGGVVGTAGGRFFGWVVGGAVPASLAADWLTSTWDQPTALYASGPAEAVIEEVCGQWLKELLGLPLVASFALVTGCQMAHVTCLAAARHALLDRHGWNVERKGLAGAPHIRIVSSNQRHGSIERAVRVLGLGSDNVVDLPVNEKGQLEARTLSQALQEDRHRPAIVVLQAGDINIGAYDPFAELIPIAHESGAWVHIDGAFGLWAAASPRYRHLLAGVTQADSWATDGHKWLNVPYDCGYAFVADSKAHWASMSHRASYLTHDTEARDQIDWHRNGLIVDAASPPMRRFVNLGNRASPISSNAPVIMPITWSRALGHYLGQNWCGNLRLIKGLYAFSAKNLMRRMLIMITGQIASSPGSLNRGKRFLVGQHGEGNAVCACRSVIGKPTAQMLNGRSTRCEKR